MGAAVIIWLIGMIIFFFFLYLVVQSAIDNTTMAGNIQEIKDLLQEMKSSRVQAASQQNDENTPADLETAAYEDCPACGNRVRVTDKTCPDCGLTLHSDSEN
ncbi:hypothetical protein [Cohnella candidum]|uniref:Zinc ribbon domain-containing protein n=1 Tax=Cohnella candidum TaxID=2674991 RepID=A0A3G3JW36_9BACL|nr:hypothetical protein [Cohnella candidum]AYQ72463.1 hypothetical protein EAV92_07710 [Cohnella candidum]